MKVIDYDPENRIPPIRESYIKDKIILSVLRSNDLICIGMAANSNSNPKTKFWKGADINSSKVTSFRDSISDSLLGIMITDYRCFGHRVSFVVIENLQELQEFIRGFRPIITNLALLNMINERGYIVFEQ